MFSIQAIEISDGEDGLRDASFNYRAGTLLLCDRATDKMISVDFIDKDCGAGDDDYLADPAVPVHLWCDWIMLEDNVVANTHYKYASVGVQLPHLTVVEIVDIAKPLSSSPPKSFKVHGGVHKWCLEEYPELVETPMFRHAIAVLKKQLVVFPS